MSGKLCQVSQAITFRDPAATFTRFYITLPWTWWNMWPRAFLAPCADNMLGIAPETLVAIYADTSGAESHKRDSIFKSDRSQAQNVPTSNFLKKMCSAAISWWQGVGNAANGNLVFYPIVTHRQFSDTFPFCLKCASDSCNHGILLYHTTKQLP